MKKSNAKKSLQLLALAGGMLFGYQNCGPGVLNSSDKASTSTTTTGTFTTGPDGVVEVYDSKAVGVSYSENTFSSMQNQTGVITPSPNTITARNTQFTKLPETGKADSVTAPMWVSITTVAGELCRDLVNQERTLAAANRRFFGLVNFAQGPAQVSAAAKDDMIRRMARSFWGRNETAQEKAVLVSALDSSFTSSNSADTQNSTMFACTAMLSSLDAHRY